MCILGALSETIGWGARAYSGNCPYNKTAFIIQIVTLIVAPVFFAACIYLILGRLITRKGAEYSYLNPKTYLWIFCTCDIVSLLVQAGGGAIASEEAEKNESTKLGSNVIVAGIIFQLITMLSFSACGTSFLVRSRHAPQPKKETVVTYGAIIAFVCIFIRNCYRTVAFLQGWTGFLSTHEAYFIALDGCMILIASIALNISDPAVLLRDDDKFVKNGDVIDEYVTQASSVYSRMEEPLVEESDIEKPQVEKPRLEKAELGDWYPQM